MPRLGGAYRYPACRVRFHRRQFVLRQRRSPEGRQLRSSAPHRESLSRPWFSPALRGHPRQRYAGADHAPLRPLSDAGLRQISLQAERWPTPTARRLCVGQPVVVQATVGNGTDELLTSQGGTPLHLAWRWRPAGELATHWRNEPRVKLLAGGAKPDRPHPLVEQGALVSRFLPFGAGAGAGKCPVARRSSGHHRTRGRPVSPMTGRDRVAF